MSPWQEWKAKNLAKQESGVVGPLALLNPDTPVVDDFQQEERISICEDCSEYTVTKQCKECGCFMPAKTKLLYASCPRGLW